MDFLFDAEVTTTDNCDILSISSSEDTPESSPQWSLEDWLFSDTTESDPLDDLFDDDSVPIGKESSQHISPDSQEPPVCAQELNDEGSSRTHGGDAREHTIAKIESIILDFLDQASEASAILYQQERPSPTIKSATKLELRLADRRKPVLEDGTLPMRSMKFPSRSKGPSIRPFAQLLRVLEVIHEALINDLPVTKRDVYYQDVGLFKSQRIVDQLVDDIAATIDVGRGDLNMRASLKGLLCGTGLRIHTVDGDVLVATNSEPILVPMAQDVSRFELDPDIRWVLIVEKEAVFQTLCSLHFTNEPSLPGPGLLITGKGYPDLATRQLVATLSNNLPETIPILALVDGDAYGLDIVSTYKFGSQALRHEEHILAAERVECIGLWASELAKLGIDQDTMLPISCADEKKALGMLRRPSSALPLLWKRELMTILHTRRKAEIEILTSVRVCLEDQPVSPSSPPHSRHPLVQYLSPKIRGRIDASAICI